jgi:beta-phosphoglucomutase-like phosphatase (HAD superfamily)
MFDCYQALIFDCDGTLADSLRRGLASAITWKDKEVDRLLPNVIAA